MKAIELKLPDLNGAVLHGKDFKKKAQAGRLCRNKMLKEGD